MPVRHDLHLPGAASDAVHPAELRLTWIGAATCLLEVAGFTLLTDPAFLHAGGTVPLGWGLRTRRLVEPSAQLEDLPPPDAVLLSHLHGDHFDDAAARDLPDDVPIVTTTHAAPRLQARGFTGASGLSAYDEAVLHRDGRRLVITSVPARHGPRLAHRLLPPVMGSVIDVWERHRRLVRVYVSGDTLMFNGIEEVASRFHDVDLALLHLGGTRALGLLVTADDEHGLAIMRTVKPATTVPVHHGDFDVFRSPVEDFVARVQRAGLGPRLAVLDRGQQATVRLSGVHGPNVRAQQPGRPPTT